LKLAATEVEVKNLFDTGGLGWGLGNLIFCDLVATGDTEITTTLGDKGGDIGGG
jgi:hypothetical protein